MKKESVRELVRMLRKLQSEQHEVGYGGYTEFYPGTEGSCIILTAPHGGNIKPSNISDRKKGCCNGSVPTCTVSRSKYSVSMVRDLCTLEMAITLRHELDLMLGERPHLVICNLNRRKCDANRDLDNAAQHDVYAERAWRDYHLFIERARNIVRLNCGSGVIFDVHGQSHPEKMIELGYCLTAEQLNTISPPELSSIRNLNARCHHTFENILRGAQSLGARLSAEGFAAVPSPAHPAPGNAKYYSGGYTIQHWGSQLGGTIDAIQLELPFYIRQNYKRDGVVIASVLADFITDFYLMNKTNVVSDTLQTDKKCISSFFWDLIERIFYL